MRELQQAVVRHLQGQRDPAGSLALWKRICNAFEKGGSASVEEFLSELAVWPGTDDEELDEDEEEVG